MPSGQMEGRAAWWGGVLDCLDADWAVEASGEPSFAFGPLVYDLSCASGAWLDLSVRLSDPRSPGVAAELTLSDGSGGETPFDAVADTLCGAILHVKAVASGLDLQIGCALMVCGAGLPDATGVDGAALSTLDAGHAARILPLALAMVNIGVRSVRGALGPASAEAPVDAPLAPIGAWFDCAGSLRAALTARSAAWSDIGTADSPAVAFFDGGWAYRLSLGGHAMGAFALEASFVEEDRFVPGSTDVNALCAIVDASLVEVCRHANAQWVGVKATASAANGLVTVGLSAILATGEASAAAEGLARGMALLREAAAALFTAAAVPFLPCAEATRTLAQPGRRATLLARDERVVRDPWERRSARLLAEGITGQAGWILTGYRLPTRGGEVEIDHLLVCPAGIFAIECRSHAGVVTGARNGIWRQELDRERIALPGTRGGNPADQSAVQMGALRALLDRAAASGTLDAAEICARGIVLFPADADLRLVGVPVNEISESAPAAFNIDRFIAVLNDWTPPKPLYAAQTQAVAALVRGASAD